MDDAIYTLEPKDYAGLNEPMTNIPYDFCDFSELDIWADGLDHDIYIYFDGAKTIGIQPVDIDGATILKGDTVTLDVSLAGITPPEDCEIVSREFFDITGRRLGDNAGG